MTIMSNHGDGTRTDFEVVKMGDNENMVDSLCHSFSSL